MLKIEMGKGGNSPVRIMIGCALILSASGVDTAADLNTSVGEQIGDLEIGVIDGRADQQDPRLL